MKQATISMFALALAVSTSLASAPAMAPDFTIKLTSGKPLKLNRYRGKLVVLAFILTTCPHCQAATRTLTKLQDEYGKRGLQVLEVAVNPQPEMNVPQFIKTFSPSFPVGYCDYQEAAKFMNFPANARRYVPYVSFIDRKGTLRAQYTGSDPFMEEKSLDVNFRGMIQKLLGVR